MIISQEKTIEDSPGSSNDLPPVAQGSCSRRLPPKPPMKVPPSHPRAQTVQVERADDPPPYVKSQASASASALLQPSAFPRPVPPLPERPAVPHRSATNHLFFKTRHEPIIGMYHIDPEMKTVALEKDGISAQARRQYNQKHRQRHRHHKRKGFFKRRVELPEPNAIFETRQGIISLDLGIIGSLGSPHSRALVQAATRQGDININVFGIDVQRRLDLEVSTRNGSVNIFIPRSYTGYIQLHSHHGELIALPNLTNASQVVYRRDREMQIVVGRSAPLADNTGDTIHVSSRHGKIRVGFIGEDTVPAKEPGFWKKLSDFLHN